LKLFNTFIVEEKTVETIFKVLRVLKKWGNGTLQVFHQKVKMRPLKNCTQTFENLLNSVHSREAKDVLFKSLGVGKVKQTKMMQQKTRIQK